MIFNTFFRRRAPLPLIPTIPSMPKTKLTLIEDIEFSQEEFRDLQAAARLENLTIPEFIRKASKALADESRAEAKPDPLTEFPIPVPIVLPVGETPGSVAA